jgi:hypothetical protein
MNVLARRRPPPLRIAYDDDPGSFYFDSLIRVCLMFV